MRCLCVNCLLRIESDLDKNLGGYIALGGSLGSIEVFRNVSFGAPIRGVELFKDSNHD